MVTVSTSSRRSSVRRCCVWPEPWAHSRHPLASAVVHAAEEELGEDFAANVERLSERSGEGLTGVVDGRELRITNRRKAAQLTGVDGDDILGEKAGMEAVVIVDGRYAATIQFRDEPRVGTAEFVRQLGPRHGVTKTMLVSGDRASEVMYLAETVGIDEVHAEMSPRTSWLSSTPRTRRAPPSSSGTASTTPPP